MAMTFLKILFMKGKYVFRGRIEEEFMLEIPNFISSVSFVFNLNRGYSFIDRRNNIIFFK
jgi:hypothetical protein